MDSACGPMLLPIQLVCPFLPSRCDCDLSLRLALISMWPSRYSLSLSLARSLAHRNLCTKLDLARTGTVHSISDLPVACRVSYPRSIWYEPLLERGCHRLALTHSFVVWRTNTIRSGSQSRVAAIDRHYEEGYDRAASSWTYVCVSEDPQVLIVSGLWHARQTHCILSRLRTRSWFGTIACMLPTIFRVAYPSSSSRRHCQAAKLRSRCIECLDNGSRSLHWMLSRYTHSHSRSLARCL